MTEKDFYSTVTNGKRDVPGEFVRTLNDLRIDYCVIGGLAVNAYAEPVVSLDMDVVVAVGGKDKLLQTVGHLFRLDHQPHSINLTSDQSDIRIRIQTDLRYQEFIHRAATRRVLGYDLRVAAIEDVLRGKSWAFLDERRRKSKRQKDLADIARLVEEHPDLRDKIPPEIHSLL